MINHQPYLSIKNIEKQYGHFTVLKNISLSIGKGEFISFLGPSGCGKTTLLRIIAGLDQPSVGSIYQNDKETTFLPPEKRDFGIVFQSYALFPNLTVEENISVGIKNKGASNREAKIIVNQWLDTIGLPSSGGKYPNQLSGGQQQRVALARALALSPGLLLLDEPLSALDAKVRIHLRNEICLLQRELGITTIMVTHDQDEALSMADRIVVMNHGVIEQVGTPQEIYQRPATRFVAEFVGNMNFIPAKVTSNMQLSVANTLLALPELTNRSLQMNEIFDLAVRPECIKFVTDNKNSLAVRVLACEFLGAFTRVDCILNNTTIMVDVPINIMQQQQLKAGDHAYIQFADHGLHGYDANSTLATAA